MNISKVKKSKIDGMQLIDTDTGLIMCTVEAIVKTFKTENVVIVIVTGIVTRILGEKMFSFSTTYILMECPNFFYYYDLS